MDIMIDEKELTISDMQWEAWYNSEQHGFHEGQEQLNIPTKLMLIVSEVSEALDWFRSNQDLSKNNYLLNGKPEGFPSELADIVIRVGDLAQILGIDLEQAVKEKMEYNKSRPYKRGKTI